MFDYAWWVEFFQGSLTDGDAPPVLGMLSPRRTVLTGGAWVDVQPDWVSGSDEVFLRLRDEVPWRAERREMWDKVVDVPRLLCHFGADDALPDPVLLEARERLSEHYAAELGDRFATAGLCHYRDGRDSVAWHGDRIGRGRSQDTMVAIISFGAARRLSLRLREGGEQIGFAIGHGDLIVMGGSCQRTWDHAILKTARPVGPRISVQFRPRGVL